MKKEFNLLRIKILLCSVLAILLLSPTILNAQRTDNFFSEYEDVYDNRQLVSDLTSLNLGGFIDEDPTVPVGSGLFIMLAAGVGYAIYRRKRSLRKGVVLLFAFALLLGTTQCKKEVLTPAVTGNEGLHIILDAGCSDDRTIFDPNATNPFKWAEGVVEYIYVGGDKHIATSGHLGTLSETGNGSNTMSFSGTLNNSPSLSGETLYFFYIGQGIERDSYPMFTTFYTDQDGQLNNVTEYHIAVGSAQYTNGQTAFNANLDMKMAIAYFDLSEFGNEDVFIYGDDIYTIADLNYLNGAMTGKAKGCIKTKAVGTGNYIALIPSTTEQTNIKFVSETRKGEITFYRGIQAKHYYSSGGNPLHVNTEEKIVGNEGLLNGKFAVAAGKQVHFSQGNLQYIGNDTKPYWKFADHQYDYLGTTTSQDSELENVNRDLFGWATSGYHRKTDYFNSKNYPFTVSNSAASWHGMAHGQVYGYGPTRVNQSSDAIPVKYQIEPSDFSGASVYYDWGVFNAIKNGGDMPGLWRTLSRDEWRYLLTQRTTSITINGTASARYTIATINTNSVPVNGIIIIPDDYSGVTTSTSDIAWGTINGATTKTQCTTIGWNDLASAGCVFLPNAGYRDITTVKDVGQVGNYWSNYNYGYADAFYLYIGQTGINSNIHKQRYYGCSVRLVRDAN